MSLHDLEKACQNDVRLRPLWQALIDDAHELLKIQVKVAFPLRKKVNTNKMHELEGALKRFQASRKALEKQCRTLRVTCPDLALKQFSKKILKY